MPSLEALQLAIANVKAAVHTGSPVDSDSLDAAIAELEALREYATEPVPPVGEAPVVEDAAPVPEPPPAPTPAPPPQA